MDKWFTKLVPVAFNKLTPVVFIIFQDSISSLDAGDEIGLFDDQGIVDSEGNVGQILVGTATWNGRDFSGKKVSTGVYLFLCTSSDFEQSVVKKILVYN